MDLRFMFGVVIVRLSIVSRSRKLLTVSFIAVYLADVFEDLGTAPLPEFDQMRDVFIELGYITKR